MDVFKELDMAQVCHAAKCSSGQPWYYIKRNPLWSKKHFPQNTMNDKKVNYYFMHCGILMV